MTAQPPGAGQPDPQRPAPPSTRNRVLAVLVLALVLLVSWLLRGCATEDTAEPGVSPSAAATTSPADETTTEADPPAGAIGIPACDPADLPPEADEVVSDIEAGGPYEYPRNDGVRFQNREGILPDEDPGYYREFTVETPGLDHRGAKRVVTGGEVEQDPEHWYYTDDHYESFCEFAP